MCRITANIGGAGMDVVFFSIDDVDDESIVINAWLVGMVNGDGSSRGAIAIPLNNRDIN